MVCIAGYQWYVSQYALNIAKHINRFWGNLYLDSKYILFLALTFISLVVINTLIWNNYNVCFIYSTVLLLYNISNDSATTTIILYWYRLSQGCFSMEISKLFLQTHIFTVQICYASYVFINIFVLTKTWLPFCS